MTSTLSSLRVIFFGTPAFALYSLNMLHEHTTLVGVITNSDTQSGRGKKFQSSVVAQQARAWNIPLLQPNTLRINTPERNACEQWFTHLQPDIAIVASYGKIIPRGILHIPKMGFVNVHASLLPRYRGASPIQAAIIHGETETGITIMHMDEGMDTGNILIQSIISIEPNDTGATLSLKLGKLGADVLHKTLIQYLNGEIQPFPQPNIHASVCSLLRRDDGYIHWNEPHDVIERKIRGLYPWPGAFTIINNQRLKILRAHLENHRLVIDEVQPEGRPTMSYNAYRCGHSSIKLPPN